MKNILNVALLKEKKQFTKKFTTFFTLVKLADFYKFSTKFTTDITLLLTTINLPHQSFVNFFFCVYKFKKKKKNSAWFMLINNNFIYDSNKHYISFA